jgi:DNA-binding PadR family transcriptional regulator
MKEKRSKYAIMGILTLGAKSGYDIRKMFERAIGNFWSESYGQIYPLLKLLVEEGLATSFTERQNGKPDRHVYSLTESGREELRRWLAEPVKDQVGRIEIALKLFFGHELSVADSVRQVELFRQMREREIGHLKEIEGRLRAELAQDPNLPYFLATASYGRHVNRALIDWCEETLSMLGGLPDANGDLKNDG